MKTKKGQFLTEKKEVLRKWMWKFGWAGIKTVALGISDRDGHFAFLSDFLGTSTTSDTNPHHYARANILEENCRLVFVTGLLGMNGGDIQIQNGARRARSLREGKRCEKAKEESYFRIGWWHGRFRSCSRFPEMSAKRARSKLDSKMGSSRWPSR